jgi:hypothetical protein
MADISEVSVCIGKRPLGRHRSRWDADKMDFKEIG